MMTEPTTNSSGTKELQTQLCTKLDIQYPIIQAGMASGITTPELVASVSNAGGLGILGAAKLTPEQTRDQIRKIKSLTGRPFAVNFLLAAPEPNMQEVGKVQQFLNQVRQELGIVQQRESSVAMPTSRLAEQISVVFEEKVPVLSFGLGESRRFLNEAHLAGVKVMTMVTTVNEAKQVAENGADIIVAQGSEAGGHRSTFKLDENGEAQLVGTMALVPQVVDSVGVPVVAAGGIMDGRGIAACLALGAQGAMLGTRFLTAKESGIFQAYKHRLLNATEADTIVTRAFTGRPARCIKNRFVAEFERSNLKPLAWPLQGIIADDIYKSAWTRNNAEFYPLLAGQGLRLLGRELSASVIVRDLVEETKRCILQLTSLTG